MATSDTCRHGLLTYERDGQSFHRYDGSRCERERARTPARGPELLAYERQSLQVAETPPTTPSRAVTAPQPDDTATGLVHDLIEPTDQGPSQPRTRPWFVGAAALTAVVLLAAGVGIGFAIRNGAVNRQQQRVTAAEQELASLHDRIASKQATIDDQERQLATARVQQQHLKRQNAQLLQRVSQSRQPTGPNATSFGDGLYQVGTAIQAGQYRTDGSDTCYWAKLSTGDTNSIVDNNLGSGPQTVTIDSPFFESEGCGTWTKTG